MPHCIAFTNDIVVRPAEKNLKVRLLKPLGLQWKCTVDAILVLVIRRRIAEVIRMNGGHQPCFLQIDADTGKLAGIEGKAVFHYDIADGAEPGAWAHRGGSHCNARIKSVDNQ